MDRLEIEGDNNCRICLEQHGLINWNKEIVNFCGITYRECYYKYTQLDDYVTDIFSQLLCDTCSKGLREAFHLIQKALKSHEILEGTNEKKVDPSDFETLYIQSTDIVENNDDDDDENKNMTKLSISETTTMEMQEKENIKLEKDQKIPENVEVSNDITNSCSKKAEKTSKTNEYADFTEDAEDIMDAMESSNSSLDEDIEEPRPKSRNKKSKKTSEDKAGDKPKPTKTRNKKCINKTLKTNKHPDFVEDAEDIMDVTEYSNSLLEDDTAKPTGGKKPRKKNYIICSYCSKLINAERIKAHEETHEEHRERSHICNICGIKLYNKASMYMHMRTHKENRERKHKCEFCEKAYYNRGDLNVHRRKHLGQMIPCPVCTKEFCRQIDVDKHVLSHSVAPLHNDVKQTEYYVECKECGKNIPSTRYKDHRDKHLQNYQMQCTLCSKHFCSKKACHKHMRTVHKKTREDYINLVIYYGENMDKRTSHLLMKQFGKVKPLTE